MKKKGIDKKTPATQGDLELWGGNLAFQIEEVRQENNARSDKHEVVHEKMLDAIKELKKSVDRNTEVTSSLTQEFREIKHIEFQVYNHEKRITELER